jgi:hypothetical protein
MTKRGGGGLVTSFMMDDLMISRREVETFFLHCFSGLGVAK